VIIARDEERVIGGALDSVAWADEVIVLDSGSADGTVAVCRDRGVRVAEQPWRGFVETKNAVAELATGDWLLSIDADEVVTPALRDEIRAIVDSRDSCDGYRVPRRNHYLGRWIRHCGWYPDYQVRLWRRGRGRWTGGRVHESVSIEGRVGTIRSAIDHASYDSLDDHLQRMRTYATLQARDRFAAGKRAGFLSLALAAPMQFLRLYFLRLGFLDGVHGLIVSSMGAQYAFLKKAKLWELSHRGDDRSAP
jgi:glycosyltransferase involved in cell wall biosynthesis